MAEDEPRNILLTIAYDGSAFHGWQIQSALRTVQGTIEHALRELTQEPCRLRGAGRTDAGVHASGQIANFRSTTRLTCERLRGGLNALTPPDVAIQQVEDVSAAFDSRRHVWGKHYRYTIANQPRPSPLIRGRAYCVRRPLRLGLMASAARALVGQHDFSAFQAADCERENTSRMLYRSTVGQLANDAVVIDVEGTAFLKNMVRIIAGTLVEVGLGRRHVASVAELLAQGDRSQAGFTAPAHGLCLQRVFRK